MLSKYIQDDHPQHDPCFILQSLYFILFSSKTLKLKCFESTFKIFCAHLLFHIFSIPFQYIFHTFFTKFHIFLYLITSFIYFSKNFISFSFLFHFFYTIIHIFLSSISSTSSVSHIISFLPLPLPHLSSFSSPFSP